MNTHPLFPKVGQNVIDPDGWPCRVREVGQTVTIQKLCFGEPYPLVDVTMTEFQRYELYPLYGEMLVTTKS